MRNNNYYRKIKKNKLNAHKVEYDGQKFDSKKEYIRWTELKLLERSGHISDLQRQVKFVLIPAQYETYERYGKKGQRLKDGQRLLEKECVYIADFVYIENGKKVVEDAKGCKEGITYQYFVLKRKLMLWIHGIRVKEV